MVIDLLAHLPRDDLGLHRQVGARAALLHELPPLAHALLRRFEEAPVVLPREQGQQLLQCTLRIAGEADLDGTTQADP